MTMFKKLRETIKELKQESERLLTATVEFREVCSQPWIKRELKNIQPISEKEIIVEEIMQLNDWKDIEYILDKISNFRGLVFDTWLKNNWEKILNNQKKV